jgi:regulator of protease activity HflC (stomatin/prohibitin superfamily)
VQARRELARLDRRRQIMEIPAQELPTADGVTVKVTAQVTWQIVDAVAAISRDANYQTVLYVAAQQAVRAAVSARSLEQLVSERAAIAAAMREAMTAEAAAVGVTIHAAALKDVMPNAETRKALAAAAIARQEALAALEKARGEQATLRALTNAARLIAEQPALAQLKGLQALAEGLRGGANIVVNAAEAGLLPVKAR